MYAQKLWALLKIFSCFETNLCSCRSPGELFQTILLTSHHRCRITEIAWNIISKINSLFLQYNCRMMIWSCNKREFCVWRNRMRRIDIVICVLPGPDRFQCLCSTLLLLCTGVLQIWSLTHSHTKRKLEEKFAKKTRRRSRSLRSGRGTILRRRSSFEEEDDDEGGEKYRCGVSIMCYDGRWWQEHRCLRP
jgi:hypothetical protein